MQCGGGGAMRAVHAVTTVLLRVKTRRLKLDAQQIAASSRLTLATLKMRSSGDHGQGWPPYRI
jgi:hypothetical protein